MKLNVTDAGIVPTKRSLASFALAAVPSEKRSVIAQQKSPYKTARPSMNDVANELVRAARKSLQELKEFIGPIASVSETEKQQVAKISEKFKKRISKRSSSLHPFHAKECLFVFPEEFSIKSGPKKSNVDAPRRKTMTEIVALEVISTNNYKRTTKSLAGEIESNVAATN